MRKENDDVCKGNISGPEEGGGLHISPRMTYTPFQQK